MALILLWMGGLSFAGCIIWVGLSGFSTHTGLAILATLVLALVGWKRLERRRRLENLLNLGTVYYIAGTLAFFVILFWRLFSVDSVPLSWWPIAFLFIVGFGLVIICRRRLKKLGLLFDLRQVGNLPRPIAPQGNIKFDGYEVVTGFSSYGPASPSKSQRGRIFLEREVQLPCVIRAKAGSIGVYEISTYRAWVEGKGSLLRESYNNNPFSVPRRIKPASHVQASILRELGEFVPRLSTISQEFRSGLIELTPERFSLLLQKYELNREEMSDACGLLLRITTLIDEHFK